MTGLGVAGSVGAGFPTVVVDESEGSDGAAKNLFCAGIAHDDVAVRGVGDDDADGGASKMAWRRASLRRRASSAFLWSSMSSRVPYQRMILPSSSRRGAARALIHRHSQSCAADAVLNVEGFAGAKGFFPRSESGLTVVGVKCADPALSRETPPL